MHRERLEVRTRGRGFHDITAAVAAIVARAGHEIGLCHLFLHHTSAALLITENADPDVLVDLETWISGLAVDGDDRFRHRAEGPDDMSAHVRSLLTETQLTVPVEHGRLELGTWQGLFLWEHRTRPHVRRLTVSVS